MDFGGISALVLAIVVAAAFAVVSRGSEKPTRRAIPFALSLAVSLLLMRPWESLYPGEWKEGIVIVFVLAAWVAVGTLLGSAVGNRLDRS